MLSLFRFAPKLKYDFSSLATDMHSHLLPGIDDGAASVGQSVKMMKLLADIGFQTIFTTPHSMKDLYPNTLESIDESYRQVKNLVPEGMSLDYSSEYFLDEHFRDNLRSQTLRPLPGNRLLIEFSMLSRPLDLEQQLFDIQLQGYQIVLAHPERYLFFQKNSGMLSRLKDMDVEFQVNALSLGGHYGDGARQAAEKMTKMGWIDFVGTDAHHDKHIDALRRIPDTRGYQRLLDQGSLKNRLLANE